MYICRCKNDMYDMFYPQLLGVICYCPSPFCYMQYIWCLLSNPLYTISIKCHVQCLSSCPYLSISMSISIVYLYYLYDLYYLYSLYDWYILSILSILCIYYLDCLSYLFYLFYLSYLSYLSYLILIYIYFYIYISIYI